MQSCLPLLGDSALMGTEVTAADYGALTVCLKELQDITAMTGWRETTDDEAADLLGHRDLPPGGNPDNDRIHLWRQDGQVVGYTQFYEGAPTVDHVFLGFLGIVPAFQRRGLARQAWSLLELEFRRCGYRWVRLNVGSRNVPALDFWIRQGFTTIVKHFRENEFLDLNLQKEI